MDFNPLTRTCAEIQKRRSISYSKAKRKALTRYNGTAVSSLAH